MFYERKVIYLDYLVKREKYGNAGFMKWEVHGDLCNITIQVSNLRETDSFMTKAYLIRKGQEKELCSVEIRQGKGICRLQGQIRSNIARTGICYGEIEKVRIPISEEREIWGLMGQAEQEADVQAAATTSEQYTEEAQEAPAAAKQYTEGEQEAPAAAKQYTEEEQEAPADAKQCREDGGQDSLRQPERRIPQYDDKWKQLWEIYPHIAPFRDEREYLSVGPNDFVILPRKYYRMVNNSFLLHGYYNYKHLILKKMVCRGEERYYIGVPGNFYDREKQVAVMFGFESFESKEKNANVGDYGYYLMRIEL